MKISYNWLKNYLPEDLHISPEKIAEYLTDSGLEVEGVEKKESIKGGLVGIVVGQVTFKDKHPDADKLSITKVNIGGESDINIVCGASNVAVGQKVIVATVGAKLYPSVGEPIVIKKSKIRGQESEGMICAEDEIGLSEDHSGIMVLDDSAIVGQPASEHFKIEDDFLIEIGLTPNRADAMSHFGVARDLIAVYNIREKTAFQLPSNKITQQYNISNRNAGPLEVTVLDSEKCQRYAGAYISGIKVKPSPDWLQNQLRIIGVRPINNVVDITNFICHGLGQPLHAFDAEAVKGDKIIVKTLGEGTVFTTLDAVERKLSASDLMICNSNAGMCIAGVFGGSSSGVSEKTTAVFLESAYFNPVSVRKTAKRHGLSTDASFRFERGIDPNITVKALLSAIELIKELAGGKVEGDIVDIYPTPIEDFKVTFNIGRCNMLIGEVIATDIIERIFKELEIEILSKDGQDYLLNVPSYRTDVQRECDIIEEILRIYSFNSVNIPEKVSISIAEQRKPEQEDIFNMVANLLASNGYNECLSNSLTKSQYAIWAENEEVNTKKNIAILNPLSSELDGMRQSLFFNGLEVISFNLNRRNDDLKIFEFGKTYQLEKEKQFKEEYHLALFSSGSRFGENWRNPSEVTGFYELKETVLTILNRLGIYKGATIEEIDHPWHEYSVRIQITKTDVVTFGKVKKDWLKKFDIRQDVFYADFKWDAVMQLLNLNKPNYTAIPKFQSVRRDLSLTIDKNIRFEQIELLARKQEKRILKDVHLFDVYQGKNLESGKKSYAVSFILQDLEKTLTDNEVDAVMQKIQASLQTELGASLRA